MRVLLVNPSRAGKGNIPVNLPLIYAVLKRAGHEVRLFDFSDYLCFQTTTQDGGTGFGTSNQHATGEVDYSALFFKPTDDVAPAVVWNDRKRYYHEYGSQWMDPKTDQLLRTGDPHADFDELCAEWRPEVVGVSCLTVDFPSTVRFLQEPKRKYGFHCVFGGVHAITLPDHAIHPDVVDSICIGEAEDAFVEMLGRMANGGPFWKTCNMWVKHGGQVHRNQMEQQTSMDTLPYMDFEVFDPLHFHRPFDGKLYRMLNYEWGRGCPYRCTYCENVVLNELYKDVRHGKKIVRHKSVEQSIAELEYLVGKYGFTFIRFWDEDFTSVNTSMLEEYAPVYKKRIGLPFLVYSRTESLSERKVELLAEMGCATFAMGIESGSEYIRRNVLDRPLTNRHIIDKFRIAEKYGISISGYNIIGLPRESRKTIFDTIKLNRIAPIARSSCTLLEPYPATPIRTFCEEEGLPADYYPNYESFSGKAQFIPAKMTREELEGLFRTFSLYVHLPRYLFPLIEMAEKDTPEGRNIFQALLRLKAEKFMDKPSYPEEDDYTDTSAHFGQIERVEEIDYADDIEQMVQKQRNWHGASALNVINQKGAEIKKFPIPDRKRAAEVLLGSIR